MKTKFLAIALPIVLAACTHAPPQAENRNPANERANLSYQLCTAASPKSVSLTSDTEWASFEMLSKDRTRLALFNERDLMIFDLASLRKTQTYDICWMYRQTTAQRAEPRNTGYMVGVEWSPSGRYILVSADNRGDMRFMLVDLQNQGTTRLQENPGSWLESEDRLIIINNDTKSLIVTDAATQRTETIALPNLPNGWPTQPKSLDGEIIFNETGIYHTAQTITVYSLRSKAVTERLDLTSLGTVIDYERGNDFAIVQKTNPSTLKADEISVVKISDRSVKVTLRKTDNNATRDFSKSRLGEVIALQEYPPSHGPHMANLIYKGLTYNTRTSEVSHNEQRGRSRFHTAINDTTYQVWDTSTEQQPNRVEILSSRSGTLYTLTSPQNAYIGVNHIRNSNVIVANPSPHYPANEAIADYVAFVDLNEPGVVKYHRRMGNRFDHSWLIGNRFYMFDSTANVATLKSWVINSNCQPDQYRF